MSDSEEWGGSTSEAVESSDAYVPIEKPKKKRNSKKKDFSDSESSPRRTSPRRTSPRRRSSNKQKQGEIMVLDASSDDDQDQENTSIIANIELEPKSKSKRKSSTKKRKSSENSTNSNSKRRNSKSRKSKEKQKECEDEEEFQPTSADMDVADDADDESDSPKPKKRGRKRKSTEAELDDNTDPPSKKARTSISSTTNNSNSKSTKKSTKSTAKGSKAKNGKNKKKTYKGSDATEQIRKKMIETNRPWTASALRTEMMESIGAAQIKKSLAELKEDGILTMREFGKKTKTLVYWANQEENDDDGDYDEMKTLQRIQELEELIKQKRSKCNKIKNKCLSLQKEPTDRNIKVKMTETFKKHKEAKEKWEGMQNDETERKTQDDVDDILFEGHIYLKTWKERMGKVWDMINLMFQDSAEKPHKLLTGKCGGELDKDNDVDWNEWKDMYKDSRVVVQRRKDDKKKSKK